MLRKPSNKEKRCFFRSDTLWIIQRRIKSAPPKANTLIELDRTVINVLRFQPQTTCVALLCLDNSSIDQRTTSTVSTLARSNV